MNRVSRGLWILAGFICVGLGVLGLVVPMMPGVVFLLIAAFCFSKSSEHYYHWLVTHPRLGPPITQWRDKGAISLNNKQLITAMLAVSVLAAWVVGIPGLVLALQVLAISGVLIFIWTRPSE